MGKVVSCFAPYNQGGLGRYLADIVEEARSKHTLSMYFGKTVLAGDSLGKAVNPPSLNWLFRIPPIRFSLGMKDFLGGHRFDSIVASQISQDDCIHGFNGKSLATFLRAKQLGYRLLILESANSHVVNVKHCHARAIAECPGVEDGWLNSWQLKRTLVEYELADEIYVASHYAKDSFLRLGVPQFKLRYRTLHVANRYFDLPSLKPHDSPLFKILMIGRVDVPKGVHILRQAFSELQLPMARLHFVGGTSSRGMNQYMRRWIAEDERVSMAPGDPIEHLADADVVVHPTYDDGFALAPMEALFLGIPVIVTEDTGMKDYVVEGRNGYIIPTGNWQALHECLLKLKDVPLRGQFDKPVYVDNVTNES